ncbi:LOW QUALITY PROTEIN: hypothetical protein HJC23_005220 [Cyclotella cryptica]|uniref:Peptidase S1 domain-containing protein n=1 Tax=Cyclotella cryptica TaxID=29204 RepID=A0ABD3P406_9STRA
MHVLTGQSPSRILLFSKATQCNIETSTRFNETVGGIHQKGHSFQEEEEEHLIISTIPTPEDQQDEQDQEASSPLPFLMLGTSSQTSTTVLSPPPEEPATSLSPYTTTQIQRIGGPASLITQDPTRHPYMASLQIEGASPNAGKFDYHMCTGFLIAPDLVMTAAHCAEYTPEGSDETYQAFNGIEVGRINLNKEVPYDQFESSTYHLNYENLVPDKVIKHPKYDALTFEHDIMIVKVFGKSRFPYVRVDSGGIVGGQEVTVLGWGADTATSSKKYSDDLREADLLVMTNDECRATSVRVTDPATGVTADATLTDNIYEDMVCASARDRYICHGDGGGPAIVRGEGPEQDVAAAVVSWGYGCVDPDYPAVMIRTADHFNWIRTVVCKESTDPPEQYACPGGEGMTLNSASAAPKQTVTLKLKLDMMAIETGFVIVTTPNPRVIAQRVPGYYKIRENEIVLERMDLPSNQCYKLILLDSFGDGFCCDMGGGSGTLYLGTDTGYYTGRALVEVNGKFGYDASGEFCLDGSTATSSSSRWFDGGYAPGGGASASSSNSGSGSPGSGGAGSGGVSNNGSSDGSTGTSNGSTEGSSFNNGSSGGSTSSNNGSSGGSTSSNNGSSGGSNSSSNGSSGGSSSFDNGSLGGSSSFNNGSSGGSSSSNNGSSGSSSSSNNGSSGGSSSSNNGSLGGSSSSNNASSDGSSSSNNGAPDSNGGSANNANNGSTNNQGEGASGWTGPAMSPEFEYCNQFCNANPNALNCGSYTCYHSEDSTSDSQENDSSVDGSSSNGASSSGSGSSGGSSSGSGGGSSTQDADSTQSPVPFDPEGNAADPAEYHLTVQFQFDDNPQDVSWVLYDLTANQVKMFVDFDVYKQEDFANQMLEVVANVDGPEAGEKKYAFTVYDKASNGLCCEHGEGYYKLFLGDVEDNLELLGDSEYEFSSSYYFTLFEEGNMTSNGAEVEGMDEEEASTDAPMETSVPTTSPISDPTASPSLSPTPPPSNMPTNSPTYIATTPRPTFPWEIRRSELMDEIGARWNTASVTPPDGKFNDLGGDQRNFDFTVGSRSTSGGRGLRIWFGMSALTMACFFALL